MSDNVAFVVIERSGMRLGLAAAQVRGVIESRGGSSAPELAWPSAPALPGVPAFEILLDVPGAPPVLSARTRATVVEVPREAVCELPELLAARVAPAAAVVFAAEGGPIVVVDPMRIEKASGP